MAARTKTSTTNIPPPADKARKTSPPDSKATAAEAKARSAPLSQSDVPAHTLADAIRIPEILRDEYGKQPSLPLDVAKAMGVLPNTGHFRMLTGAAVAYGLTDGGAFAQLISLTDLGRRIVAPTEEGDDLRAMRDAVLRPRVVREFLEKYNTSPLPSEVVALNVIESMGVPTRATKRAYEMILTNAEGLGLLVEINGKRFVRLDNAQPRSDASSPSPRSDDTMAPSASPSGPTSIDDQRYEIEEAPAITQHRPAQDEVTNNRVFITHGQNIKIVEQIRKILTFGKFEAVVSVDKQTVAKPVPDKVMDDMRTCRAAIVHVGSETKLMDPEGKEHTIINQNVLIEIGAAMALYRRRFVLLVERGVQLPSNLQGLYEVRYIGDQLDHEATMKLLEAFNDFR